MLRLEFVRIVTQLVRILLDTRNAAQTKQENPFSYVVYVLVRESHIGSISYLRVTAMWEKNKSGQEGRDCVCGRQDFYF